MTVEAWVRPDRGVVEGPWYPNIVGRRDHNGIYPPWVIGLGAELQLYTVIEGAWVYGETRLELERWAHLAVVFDGREVRTYVDGVMDLQRSAATMGPPNDQAIFLGALGSGQQRYRGDIGAVRISSVARYRDRFVPERVWALDAPLARAGRGQRRHRARSLRPRPARHDSRRALDSRLPLIATSASARR
jgi:hypothetical protein